MKIALKGSVFAVYIDGHRKCHGTGYGSKVGIGKNIEVWMADPWHRAAKAKVKSMRYQSLNTYRHAKVTKPRTRANGQYIGCFRDCKKNKRDLPHLKPKGNKDQCNRSCKGYKYFGRQWKQECWCGNNYGSQGKSSPCKLHAHNIGPCRNAVYKVRL